MNKLINVNFNKFKERIYDDLPNLVQGQVVLSNGLHMVLCYRWTDVSNQAKMWHAELIDPSEGNYIVACETLGKPDGHLVRVGSGLDIRLSGAMQDAAARFTSFAIAKEACERHKHDGVKFEIITLESAGRFICQLLWPSGALGQIRLIEGRSHAVKHGDKFQAQRFHDFENIWSVLDILKIEEPDLIHNIVTLGDK